MNYENILSYNRSESRYHFFNAVCPGMLVIRKNVRADFIRIRQQQLIRGIYRDYKRKILYGPGEQYYPFPKPGHICNNQQWQLRYDFDWYNDPRSLSLSYFFEL